MEDYKGFDIDKISDALAYKADIDFENTNLPETLETKADVQALTEKANTDLSNATLSSTFLDKIINAITPDYTKGVSKSTGTTLTAESNGVLEAWVTKPATGGATVDVTVNNKKLTYSVDDYGHGGIYRVLRKGDKYSIVLNNGAVARSVIFFPYRT